LAHGLKPILTSLVRIESKKGGQNIII